MLFGRLERRIVADLESRLRRQDPELAGRFAVFERLCRDDGPPPPEVPSHNGIDSNHSGRRRWGGVMGD